MSHDKKIGFICGVIMTISASILLFNKLIDKGVISIAT